MKRQVILDRIDDCISQLTEILLWESRYSDAGIHITDAMSALGKAARYLSREEMRALREEVSGVDARVERFERRKEKHA